MATYKISDSIDAHAAAIDYAERTGAHIEALGYSCPCAGCYADGLAEWEAERDADLRNERWFEERGANSCMGIPNFTDPQGGSCLCC